MPTPESLLWMVWLAPLAASALIVLLALRRPVLAAALATTGLGLSFLASLVLISAAHAGAPTPAVTLRWLEFGAWRADLALAAPRSALLLLGVVTLVALCVAWFSRAYLADDPGRPRYYACLSLFVFSMLGLVLADNLILLFVCWELVGVVSYLLVGFWFEKPAAADAARKAFLVNRIGDFGLLLGLVMLISATGTVSYFGATAAWPAAAGGNATLVALLVFAGVAAKSAQVPLHVWLPDAMEGPTPVSALIHAATMVAAGVYLLCRLAFLLTASPAAAALVSMLGAVTALLAALIAVTQTDLKRVLAYSTISQLGYMVMAAGLGGTTPALFHLATHACFKALLFLCAGSVIIALHHHQDLREMGGLRKRLPLTFAAFLVGTLALAGVWPLSGFYSKDAILVLAWQHDAGLFACAAAAAMLTAFYMGRCLLLAFFGEPRSEIATHPHRDEGLHVSVPLIALALAAIASGWADLLPKFLEGHSAPPAVVVAAHPTLHAAAVAEVPHDVPTALHLLLPLLPLIGFIPAFLLYRAGGAGDAGLRRAGGSLYRLSERKFYFDEILSGIESVGQGAVAWFTAAVERGVFQRAVPVSAAFLSGWARRAVSVTQSGNLRAYALVCALGSLVFVLILLIAEGT